ncbi:MAG TPA: DUF3618 domain-containing protein [Pseudonocardia sp.]|nr:DUF3618 domain-containing protein [Pseudonocardia sp.]
MTSASDPEQIRREIERTQANLSQDVDALSEKVTPSKVVERRVGRAKSTANRWKDKVMGSNPLSSTGQGNSGGFTQAAHGVADRASGTASHAAHAVSGTASSAAQTVSDRASSAASSVSDAASSAVGTVQEAPQAVRRQTQGNPLAAGLIAFGAGWLVSSLLPASRREQELAGQAKDRAQELAQPLAEQAKQVAGEVKENLREPAQQAVESVKSTATDAGQTVADEGRAAAGQVQGRAQEAGGNVREHGSSSR